MALYLGSNNVAINNIVEKPIAVKKQINFIDYDGTILHSYTKTEIEAMTSENDLPANPSHIGLVAQGWNWTLSQIKAQLTAMPNNDVWVGQMYITASGDTEIDVYFADAARLSPYFVCSVNGTITIDWGDNSTSTVTGTSLTSRVFTQHVYSTIGNYTITVHVESGSWALYTGTSLYALLCKSSSSSASSPNRVYSNCVKAVRVGADTSLGGYALSQCFSLASITIPSNVTSIGSYVFYNCSSLASITIPSDVDSIGGNAFYNCSSLTNITIPSDVTSIGSNVFYNCSSLTSVAIPSDVTSIGNNAFGSCSSLASITIPSDVTSIGNNAFSTCSSLASITIPSDVDSIGTSAFINCYGMAEYHFESTTPPTFGTTPFDSIVDDCIIYVPTSAVDTYKTALPDYTSYIQGE